MRRRRGEGGVGEREAGGGRGRRKRAGGGGRGQEGEGGGKKIISPGVKRLLARAGGGRCLGRGSSRLRLEEWLLATAYNARARAHAHENRNQLEPLRTAASATARQIIRGGITIRVFGFTHEAFRTAIRNQLARYEVKNRDASPCVDRASTTRPMGVLYCPRPVPAPPPLLKVLDRHVLELKESSPDYIDDEDFERRLDYYREAYETVEVKTWNNCGS